MPIPKVGEPHQFTAHEVQEYIKCSKDPVYFIRNYMKIIQVDKGLVPFDLYPYQEKMLRSYHEHRFNITMTSRQAGKSTTVMAFFLHYILFNVNVNACVAANKQTLATDLLGRLKLAYEYLPRFLQQGVVQWAQTSIELENGSRVFAAATSSSAVRGGSYNLILLDEFAHILDNTANAFYASTFPTISSGKTTKVIIVSTPNGLNLFHKIWVNAKLGRNDFKPIFVHWTEIPGRDERWKETEIRNIGGPEIFAQEYEGSFLSSSYTLINGTKLQSMAHDDPIVIEEDGCYREYLKPEAGKQYVMTIDTATGQGLDASVFAIIDVTSMPYRLAAIYSNNKIRTMEYPDVIIKYARKYHEPWILLEINDIGRDIANILFRDYEYSNLLTTTTQDKRQGQKLTFGYSQNRQLGLKMTMGVKRSGCSILKALIENDQLIAPDYRLIQELSTFVQKGVVFEAQEGTHDDHVMALVVFAWASLQPAFVEVTGVRALESYTKLLQKMRQDGAFGKTNYPIKGETGVDMVDDDGNIGNNEFDPLPLPNIDRGSNYDDGNWLNG